MQCCFNKIETHHSDNDYHIDHIAKEKFDWNGNLPDVMDVVEDAEHLLNDNDMDDDENDNEMTYT